MITPWFLRTLWDSFVYGLLIAAVEVIIFYLCFTDLNVMMAYRVGSVYFSVFYLLGLFFLYNINRIEYEEKKKELKKDKNVNDNSNN